MVALAKLLGWGGGTKEKQKTQKVSSPFRVEYGFSSQARKGEDFALFKPDCQRLPQDGSSTFAVFAVLDGHSGPEAAIYSKENLLMNIMSAIPPGLSRDEWLAALPQAMVAGFVKTDKDFQSKELTSGTTATLVVIDGWTVTVACVGDSRCILDSQMGIISTLTVDHRLEENIEERERVRLSGGEVCRLSIADGVEIGPLRCWPGGLCLSRSIGDMDIGEFIVPIPHVKQIKLLSAGGRLIIASDGVWDAMTNEQVAKCCRGLPAELAAKHIVKEALKNRGLRDDTTCIVVDIMSTENLTPKVSSLPPSKKNHNIFMKAFLGKRGPKLAEEKSMEELFEDGSAVLADRLRSLSFPQQSLQLLKCNICEVNIRPGEGISMNASSPLEGPLLCPSCKLKEDTVEGFKVKVKVKVSSQDFFSRSTNLLRNRSCVEFTTSL